MSENKSILITFFDINGEYRNDVFPDIEKNFLFLDNPMRIIEQYINENFIQDIKKQTEDQFVIRYKFSYEIEQNTFILVNCDIISNYSLSHQSTLYSNGYIVFCDLERNSTLDLLDKIIDYIRENCSINVKTYIIGIFKENIDEKNSYQNMLNFLDGIDFEYDYYEMYLGDKNKFSIISKEYENSKTMDEIFKTVFKEIYESGYGPRTIKSKKSQKLKDGDEHRSRGNCNIF